MAGRKPKSPSLQPEKGNFVSEWFGHRVFPTVSTNPASLADQRRGGCPFLREVTGEDRLCVKPPTSSGICTISSCSNGPRQDWLVCPYRALDPNLLENAAGRLFRISRNRATYIVPAPRLMREDVKNQLAGTVASGGVAIVYLQDKLGGEISLPPTDRSPELAFDITMAEITYANGRPEIGRYGILEVQTMDFHGSYKNAVNNLKDGLRLHSERFPEVLQQNPTWLSDRIEGPNIANVFKRTFYQMMLKFQIAAHAPCAGCVLALPESVWGSWQRHLGKPELQRGPGGMLILRHPNCQTPLDQMPSWIYVFDVDPTSSATPSPIIVKSTIATDAESISYYALKVAPEAAIAEGGHSDRIVATIRKRISALWPELGVRSSGVPDAKR